MLSLAAGRSSSGSGVAAIPRSGGFCLVDQSLTVRSSMQDVYQYQVIC
jgi:hypothetical protein